MEHKLVTEMREMRQRYNDLVRIGYGWRDNMIREQYEGLEPWQVGPERDKAYKRMREIENEMRDELVKLAGESLVDAYEEIVRDHAYDAVQHGM